jgi:hypothetical protein
MAHKIVDRRLGVLGRLEGLVLHTVNVNIVALNGICGINDWKMSTACSVFL